jgi:sortase B
MTSSNKKKILNGIIAAAMLLLAVTAYVAWERSQAQNNYERLSEQRADQLKQDASAAISPPASSKTDSTGAVEGSSSPEASYVYKENINKKWLAINPDFMGWLQIPGTNIDYPFVRSKDNQDYLKRDFNGNYSEAGTLFLDYRNLGNFNDSHTLIYGHNMKNKSMFQNLTYYQDAKFFSQNQLIQLSGLYETKTYKIFSVYEISADDYVFTLQFENVTEYLAYLNGLEDLSLHPHDLVLEADQKLLTLVTCSYGVNNGRTIVHAVEVPEE